MIARNPSWWPRAAAIGLMAWGGRSQLTAIADVGEPKIGIVNDDFNRPVAFEAVGLSPADLASLKTLRGFDPTFKQVFAVYVVTNDEAPDEKRFPSVSGKYNLEGSTLKFVPRHPLKAGLTYRAILNVPGLPGENKQELTKESSVITIERKFTVPEAPSTQTIETLVENVFPTSNVLPENHLRFYIQFSQPVARGAAYKNLELLDEFGVPIEDSFLEIGEELWDPYGRRFTLLLDPGRVKQGLKPRQELGPILVDGKKYTLRISSNWRDKNGKPLAAEYRKEFTVGPAIETAIDIKQWTIDLPEAGSRDPFVVDFPYSLDHALLKRAIWVESSEGERILGQVTILPGERRWKLTPDRPWQREIHELVIDTSLEDTSGNSIARPFEVDQVNRITHTSERDIIRIPFEISSLESSTTAKSKLESLPGNER